MRSPRRVLITGGAGFVGSSLAIDLRSRVDGIEVVAADNLRRRGSELNVERLLESGVEFVHADVRERDDLAGVPRCDLVIDCAAEPSVLAGIDGGGDYVLRTNILGTVHALEVARRDDAAFLFLSTSRVYPHRALNALAWRETETRHEWTAEESLAGYSEHGVAEDFSLVGPRSLYGASKLSSEHLVEEYCDLHGIPALILRCGVLAGPWQMGRTDQGFVSLWVARHLLGGALSYLGFGGDGRQVRDLLHVDDLADLVHVALARPEVWDARVYNVGGGRSGSVSLRELTALCVEATGRTLEIGSRAETNPVDVRIYLGDSRRIARDLGWRPTRGVERIVEDTARWLGERARSLGEVLSA